jgi:hypothetical protein
VQGTAAEPVPLFVDFDNPHVGADVTLEGQYPSGVIDWGEDEWKVYPPGGRMSTFSVGVSGNQRKATFSFAYPRILMGFDVYIPGDGETKLTLRAPEMREVTFILKGGQLRHLKTGWMNRASEITVESDWLPHLRFDNLAYSPYIWARNDWSE